MADSYISGLTNSPFIGVEKFGVAPLLTDPVDGTPTYGATVMIPHLREVQVRPATNAAKLYADNGAIESATTLSEYALTINTATMPLEYRAMLLGHTYDKTTGTIKVGKDDTPPYFAVMFVANKSNGKKRFVRFTKVKFAESDETYNTKGESIEFNTPQITATGIYRTSDNVALEQADEEAEGYVEDTGTKWFTLTTAAAGT